MNPTGLDAGLDSRWPPERIRKRSEAWLSPTFETPGQISDLGTLKIVSAANFFTTTIRNITILQFMMPVSTPDGLQNHSGGV